ncbi:MAG: hypothetical protein P0119_08395 [Nitrospira sp.]|nr:hypothetical protein [Nitrospira sp.]
MLAGDPDERFPNLIVEPQHRNKQDLPTHLLLTDRPPKLLLGFILAGEDEAIATGDEDLLTLRRHRNLAIVSPRQFLKRLHESQ